MTTRDDDPGARDDDADVRAAFARIRSEDAAGAPAFDKVLAAPSRGAPGRRRPWLVPALAGTMAAAGLAVAVIVVERRPESRLPPLAAIEHWTPPTDFLLETPGRDLLAEVPRIGELPGQRRSITP